MVENDVTLFEGKVQVFCDSRTKKHLAACLPREESGVLTTMCDDINVDYYSKFY